MFNIIPATSFDWEFVVFSAKFKEALPVFSLNRNKVLFKFDVFFNHIIIFTFFVSFVKTNATFVGFGPREQF